MRARLKVVVVGRAWLILKSPHSEDAAAPNATLRQSSRSDVVPGFTVSPMSTPGGIGSSIKRFAPPRLMARVAKVAAPIVRDLMVPTLSSSCRYERAGAPWNPSWIQREAEEKIWLSQSGPGDAPPQGARETKRPFPGALAGRGLVTQAVELSGFRRAESVLR